jgi:uncharacterized protein
MNLVEESSLYIEKKEIASQTQIRTVLQLAIEEDCTVPFIARYRKEKTGNLDETVIRDILESFEEYKELEKRRAFIFETIEKMGKLDPEIKRSIEEGETVQRLDDIYAPFKAKRKTKSQKAIERGLEPLADLILSTSSSLEELEKEKSAEFLGIGEEPISDFSEAVQGACDILIYRFSHDIEIKEELRSLFWKKGEVVSQKHKDAETIKDFSKFQDFFDYRETIKSLNQPKAGHRYLAVRRGSVLKILKVETWIEPALAYGLIRHKFFPKKENLSLSDLLEQCGEKAFTTFLHPSLDLEIKMELKKSADETSIDVFGKNLKNLLLAPYLGAKTVMGVDPGIRTGCKIVVIDKTGKLMEDTVVYPHPPRNDKVGSARIVQELIQKCGVEFISIGNGTYGRETLVFVQEDVDAVSSGSVSAVLISESGASVYSASPLAKEELPDKDLTVRGAVSIARRFQDPLAELVKIDPKSIGVGQYQHDVSQTKLKKSLGAVVEDCVNYVGVDLNTASAQLLSYVSGIGQSLAEKLVKFRESEGGVSDRQQLLKAPRFTDKIFEQAAGFLRIYGGINPLDATFIHPERYGLLEGWGKSKDVTMAELVRDPLIVEKLEKDESIKREVGEATLEDIIKSLRAPTQDPRKEFESVPFQKGLKKLEEVQIGSWYTGSVGNITHFGAFVDIGIKESGLIHVSEMSTDFIKNPMEYMQVGQVVKVRVLSIDFERKRLGLSCKPEAKDKLETKSKPDRFSNRPSKNRDARKKKPVELIDDSSPFDVLKKLNF